MSKTISRLPWWLRGKASACNTGDLGLIPGSGRSPEEGNGNPLRYSCLENPMDGEPGSHSPWGHKELGTTERLHFHVHIKWYLVLVAQSSLTLCNLMDCSPPGSSVHGIL